jgi:hypothetical protein
LRAGQSPARVHGAALICIFGIVSEAEELVPVLEQNILSVPQWLLLLVNASEKKICEGNDVITYLSG